MSPDKSRLRGMGVPIRLGCASLVFAVGIVTLTHLSLAQCSSETEIGLPVSFEEASLIRGAACVFDQGPIGTACGGPHIFGGEGAENNAVSPQGPGNIRTVSKTCSCSTTTYWKNTGLCVPADL